MGELADLEARLIRVARQSFIDKGYGATSMNEIALAARVSKGTLYVRFPSKADLFRAIIELHIRQASIVTRPVRNMAETLEATLQAYIERGLEFNLSEGNLELNRLIFAESDRFPEIAQALVVRFKASSRDVADIIRESAIADGIPCSNPEEVAEMLMTLIRGFYIDISHRERPAKAEEISNWARKNLKLFLAARPHW